MPEDELMRMSEAAQLLGVSNAKMWRLVRDGILEAETNPLDRRVKLVNRVDVEKLLRYSKKVSRRG